MALLLRDIVGLSYTEIADSLEITLATVKWRIYKAREEVQSALVREGVGVADLGCRRPQHDHRVEPDRGSLRPSRAAARANSTLLVAPVALFLYLAASSLRLSRTGS